MSATPSTRAVSSMWNHANIENSARNDDHEDPRRDRGARPVLDARGGEVAARAGHRGGEDDVAEGDQRGRAHAGHRAEAVGDEGVEPAGRAHPLAHLDVADREDRQHDRGDDERGGCGEAPAEHRDRHVEEHGRERRRAGHDAEEDLFEAEGVLGEPAVQRVGGRGTVVSKDFCHLGSPWQGFVGARAPGPGAKRPPGAPATQDLSKMRPRSLDSQYNDRTTPSSRRRMIRPWRESRQRDRNGRRRPL